MKRKIAGWLLFLCLLTAASDVYAAQPLLERGKGRTVAITFDDGPRPGYVESILKILREKGVRATFFVVGRYAAEHPGLIRAMADDGIKLA